MQGRSNGVGLKTPKIKVEAKGLYQFKNSSKVKRGDGYIAGHSYHLQKEPEPLPPQEWDGKPIDSIEEWRWILASLYYQVNFEYQMNVAGGRNIAGGLVLDFMMYTQPLWTPVSIKGRYWHTGRTEVEDLIREATLAEVYKGRIFPLVSIYSDELPDLETAKIVFRRMVPL